MKPRKSTVWALISLGVVITTLVTVTELTFSSNNQSQTQYYTQPQYMKEDKDDVVPLQDLYSDRSDSPQNNPALHLNSTEDLQAPLTEVINVLDNANLPVNETDGRYVISGKYVMIEFNATDKSKIDHFECSENGESWTKCKSPHVVYNTEKSNETKTIEIRATDIHNNIEQQPASLLYETR